MKTSHSFINFLIKLSFILFGILPVISLILFSGLPIIPAINQVNNWLVIDVLIVMTVFAAYIVINIARHAFKTKRSYSSVRVSA